MSKQAKLRVCASCEWLFDWGIECPKCGFGSYSARYVYGNAAYRYKHTQQPYIDQQINKRYAELYAEIRQSDVRQNPKLRVVRSLHMYY